MEGGGEDGAAWLGRGGAWRGEVGGGNATARRDAPLATLGPLVTSSVRVLQVCRVDTCSTISVFSEAVVIRTAPGHPPPRDRLVRDRRSLLPVLVSAVSGSFPRLLPLLFRPSIHTLPTFWNHRSVPLRRNQLTLRGKAFHYLSYHKLKVFNL